MGLTLTIENETRLPDGGPLSVRVSGTRGIDIGRDQHLDWTLPDPSRAISGRHCEVRYRDGGYWLHDVSTNGTFVNGGEHRVQSPYRLRHGDRVEIGHYIIAVVIDGEGAATGPSAVAPMPDGAAMARTEFWAPASEPAAPIPRRDLQPARELRPVRPDFIDWAIDTPAPTYGEPAPPPPPPAAPPAAPRARPASEGDDLAWAPRQVPRALAVEPPPPVPTPRRPPPAPAAGRDPWNESAFAPMPGTERPGWPEEEVAPPVAAPAPPAMSFEPAPAPAWGPGLGPAFAPAPQPSPGPSGSTRAATEPVAADFIERFAKGAGLSPGVVDWQDAGALAEQLGALLRLVSADLKQLLAARAESKRIARSGSQTMIQAHNNNPLKFSPTVDDAMQWMFGRPASGYLDARRAFEESFKDLKAHQVKTYSAMQHALRMLLEDLDPEALSESVDADRGLAAIVGSRKAKLWDAYVARWQAKTAPYDDGMIDAFMVFFAECYDRGSRGDK
jgi:type VI secretion system protein ImpI